MKYDIHVCNDAESLAQHACKSLVSWIKHHLASEQRPFCLALSGGSTPKRLYQLLAELPAGEVDWHKVLLIWGDERTVPHDHPESNYRMVKENLLDKINIPADNVLPVPDPGQDPASSAKAYDQHLRSRLPQVGSGQINGTQTKANPVSSAASESSLPLIDCVLLGLGDDAHTASLFPGTKALTTTDRAVVENEVPQLDTWRITLTTPVINAARFVTFLVAGEKKTAALEQLWHGELNTQQVPSQLIQPDCGQVYYMLDQAALGALPTPASSQVVRC